MGGNWNIIAEEGFRFFGKMSASISHEIKNALAIINENAGLLKDYTLMADKGKPLEPERLKTLAEKVMNQIRRTDGIVRNLSRFAHSADESVESVDLGETLRFLIALSGRFASTRGVTLESKTPESPVMITTHPFLLLNLLWLCLDFAMDAMRDNRTFILAVEKADQGARIKLPGLESLTGIRNHPFPSEQGNALLSLLRAELKLNGNARELVLTLPRDVRN